MSDTRERPRAFHNEWRERGQVSTPEDRLDEMTAFASSEAALARKEEREAIAKILRFESGDAEDEEYFIPAEPGPLGPFQFAEAVQEFMKFIDREFKKLDDQIAIHERTLAETGG